MQPIHALLARIRWDPTFGAGRFELGYWDRKARQIRRIALADVGWDADNRSMFTFVDGEGVCHTVPLSRVREVWRDGHLIWRRHG
ncbi:MAG: DUF504 domain-containing protein [Rhodocyclaceae bacterium]|nr:DUF504 domain-containing protein [Rhodocyclaceae bacterium]